MYPSFQPPPTSTAALGTYYPSTTFAGPAYQQQQQRQQRQENQGLPLYTLRLVYRVVLLPQLECLLEPHMADLTLFTAPNTQHHRLVTVLHMEETKTIPAVLDKLLASTEEFSESPAAHTERASKAPAGHTRSYTMPTKDRGPMNVSHLSEPWVCCHTKVSIILPVPHSRRGLQRVLSAGQKVNRKTGPPRIDGFSEMG
ncbi:hypothetical protein J7T55_002034 [Diaporthe amygdali]|uniref:uncharacterized protein n=1 Tax=Phomopsis amygdali TaxID=1214568 RepID=UPI0022FF1E5F|nr:uncharacterized protein J7T55_002034 [Diaporthe amygdali]KAJ0108430.1 hypothetical protein J7T55_002034 [Diaporthe amygdali]